MIKLHLHRPPNRRAIEIFMYDHRPNGELYEALPTEIIFKKVEEKDLYSTDIKPTFCFDGMQGDEFMRGLATALSEAGYKPNTDIIEGELKATKIHLEDMRTLTFEMMRKK